MRKKGGMELSINAIVILIIAMVVLGIGILFIRGLFSKSAEKLTTAISAQDVQNPATADRPLVADKEVLLSRTNPTKTIVLSIFNAGSATAEGVTVEMTDCITSGATALSDTDGNAIVTNGNPVYDLKTAPQDIARNTYVGYQAIASFTSDAELGQGDTIVCRLKAAETTSPNVWAVPPSTTVTFTVTS